MRSVSAESPLARRSPSTQRDRVAAQLRDALGVGVAQEVADPVRLVLGHQRRALRRRSARRSARARRAGRAARGSRRRSRARSTTARRRRAPPRRQPPSRAPPCRDEPRRADARPRTGSRARRSRAPCPPTQGEPIDDDRAAQRERAAHVERAAPAPAPRRRPDEPAMAATHATAISDVRSATARRVEAEVAGGPDPDDLRGSSGRTRLPERGASVSGEEVGGSRPRTRSRAGRAPRHGRQAQRAGTRPASGRARRTASDQRRRPAAAPARPARPR